MKIPDHVSLPFDPHKAYPTILAQLIPALFVSTIIAWIFAQESLIGPILVLIYLIFFHLIPLSRRYLLARRHQDYLRIGKEGITFIEYHNLTLSWKEIAKVELGSRKGNECIIVIPKEPKNHLKLVPFVQRGYFSWYQPFDLFPSILTKYACGEIIQLIEVYQTMGTEDNNPHPIDETQKSDPQHVPRKESNR
ncbi:hypothetical protein ACQZV8_16580 [Magnetococcales bacterium HHB-1]